MSPVFSARRRADEFDALVEAAASGRPVEDARFTELLEVVGTLRQAPAPAARPEFVASLRERLMAAAADELTQLTPTPVERLTVAPRKTPRERRLAIAVGGVAIVGATTSMAVAAQSALPGDVLYPLKRAMENAQTGVRVDDAAKGSSLLANARGRLAEIDELTRSSDGQDLLAIEQTLEAFAEQATEASDLLLADYAETGSEASIEQLQDFTAQSLAALEQLSAVLPPAAQQALVEAGELLAQIAQTTLSLCPTCSGEQIDKIPSFLVQAASDVVGKVLNPKSGDTPSAGASAPTKPKGSSTQVSGGTKDEQPATATPESPSILEPPADGSGGGAKDDTGDDGDPLGDALDPVLNGAGTPASGPGAQQDPVTELVDPVLGLVDDLLNPDPKK
jgi:hypothetical protein